MKEGRRVGGRDNKKQSFICWSGIELVLLSSNDGALGGRRGKRCRWLLRKEEGLSAGV